jgi:hypothetical protein
MASTYNQQNDPQALVARGPGDPASDAVRITPADGANLALYCKALRIYVPGTISEASVKLTPAGAKDDADTVTLKYVPGVTYEPLSVRKVFATGTTAGIEIHGYTV